MPQDSSRDAGQERGRAGAAPRTGGERLAFDAHSARRADAVPGAPALEVWRVDLGAASDALADMEAALPRLSPDDARRFDAIADEAVRRERRAAHIALRLLLERAHGSGLRRMPFAYSVAGKPRLAPLTGDFSLAHIDDLALVALVPSGTVGVDVERVRKMQISDTRRSAIVAAARSLCPDKALPEEPEARFLQAWVRLEALAKAEGSGIGPVLTRLGVARGVVPAPTPADIAIHDLDLGAGLAGAVAVTGVSCTPALRNLPATRTGLEAMLRAGTDSPDR